MASQKQRYDDEFRASAVVALEAAGYPNKKGALTGVARALGMPHVTLRRWAEGESNPPPNINVHKKRTELSELLDLEIRAALGQMNVVRGAATYRDLGTVAAILIDKKQILTGKPTWIVEISDLLREGKVTPKEVEEELGVDLATELFESIGLSASTDREAKA